MAEYIEREQVKDELLSWAVCIKHPEHLMREDALHVIDSIPAADVAPVVHGLWRYRSKGRCGVELFCTACDSAPGSPQRKTKCCPNCGARMDGE